MSRGEIVKPKQPRRRAASWCPLAGGASAVAVIALAAQFVVPVPGALGGVPITGQSLAVLVAAALLGPRRGALVAGTYVALAACGAPILAEGRGGWDAVRGSSAGFLLGFVVGALVTGWLESRMRRPAWVHAWMAQVAGTCVVLVCGWARLAWRHGAVEAYRGGVEPFLLGAALKALVGAVIVCAVRRVCSGGPAADRGALND